MALPDIKLFRRVPDGGFQNELCNYKTGNAADHSDCTWNGHKVRVHGQPNIVAPIPANGAVLQSVRRLNPNIQAKHAEFLHELGHRVTLPLKERINACDIAKKHAPHLRALLKPLSYQERLQQLYRLQNVLHLEAQLMIPWDEPNQSLALDCLNEELDTFINKTLNSIRREAIIQQQAENISLKGALRKWGKWTCSKIYEYCCAVDDALPTPYAKHRKLLRQAQRMEIPQHILDRFDRDLKLFNSNSQYVSLVCNAWMRFKSPRAGSSRNINNFIRLIQGNHLTVAELRNQCIYSKEDAKFQAYRLLRIAGIRA